MAPPQKRELRRFCEIDGWDQIKQTDHYRYTKRLPDGDLLRTKVSLGAGPACNDPNLWAHIWRTQLRLESEDQFWEAVQSGEPVPRGPQPGPKPEPQMDAWLFEHLVYRNGMPEDDVLALSAEEAMNIYLQDIGLGPPDQEPPQPV